MLSPLSCDPGARLSTPFKPLAVAVGMMLGMAASGAAWADISDTLHPFVSVTRSYDANLFRYAEQAPIADADRDDTLTQTQVGISIDRPLGRQKLTGAFKVSKVAFDRYDMLDYTGKDFSANLDWMLGSHLDGRVGATYGQTLTSFSDFRQAARSLQVQRREYFEGGWRFHPSWRVRTGYSNQKVSYDLQAQKFNDRTEDSKSVGIDYLASSGSKVGLQFGRVTGRYDNHFLAAGVPIDDGYTQDELKVNVQWIFSATSQFQMLAGRAERKHTYFTRRDSSGLNGRAVFNWSMLRRLNMTASAWREYASVDSNEVSNSFNKGVSLNAQWELTGKISADASARRERRDFIAIPGVTSALQLNDDNKNYSAGISYAPLKQLRLYVGGFRETRDGSRTNSYRTHGMSLSARAQF
ncbi:XrtB/PEP-CTERM-associated polysaccharide biosynthesis outer membrane protein EpsL [Duganella sp. BuS-21]|uniref:XrtB/PEP-CTERM-associated polysaccharide biosynthesis outer membrane protein EpsL n=1 Tax=Duganella sp. BuS-21 TaxID=2943848 RepID=UPI0035A57F37